MRKSQINSDWNCADLSSVLLRSILSSEFGWPGEPFAVTISECRSVEMSDTECWKCVELQSRIGLEQHFVCQLREMTAIRTDQYGNPHASGVPQSDFILPTWPKALQEPVTLCLMHPLPMDRIKHFHWSGTSQISLMLPSQAVLQ